MRYQKFDQLLYFRHQRSARFHIRPSGPEANDVGFSDSAYPDYFLGLGNSYLRGFGTA